ncbi:MAG: hypothetical protein Q4F95_03980 [Oscillospiraceae bacterium]|nr:hypothetical protein [Oscillospiraceae bacterium]
MKHIVFVLESYPPETSATVTCVKNIIDMIKMKDEYKITCICGTNGQSTIDNVDGVQIYRIHHKSYSYRVNKDQNRFIKQMRIYAHFVHSVFVLPFFPNVELAFSEKIYKILNKINKKSNIDCVIASFRPFATMAGMIKFKKKYKDVKTIAYFLDIMRGANPPKGMNKEKYIKFSEERERKNFCFFNAIIMPEASKYIYNTAEYINYGSKIYYCNFPVLIPKANGNLSKEIAKTKMIAVFAGTTDSQFRNPEIAMQIFEKINSMGIDIQFHIYGKSNMIQLLSKFQSDYPDAFHYYGLVNKEKADSALNQAAFVVNIGNNVAGMVPSKTFEIMNLKKSIIHFTEGKADSSAKYIEDYPDSVIIDVNDNIDDSARRLMEFINGKHVTVTNELLLDKFYSATPDAVVELIQKIVE